MTIGSSRKSLLNSLLLLLPSTVVIILGKVLALTYQFMLKLKLCGSPGGPPITSPRIKLREGSHLAYKEHGLPREKSRSIVIFIHG
ncbi:hypothetical protein Bca52824_006934 [Brassica carinata]|uniref:Uncharacterized protein n=1 Tax=Brassica carinata TaxID=52824 RepID=A0A8X7W6Y3_BRACI|nr:hypothetical protein Bca52824_006934 [Brassica carinata]